jgi:hypothetical protein
VTTARPGPRTVLAGEIRLRRSRRKSGSRHPLALPHRTHRPGKADPAPVRAAREADHQADFFVDELFANYKDIDELDKPQSYYKHADRWANRLIQGDSLMVMASLLEREGMKGQVQMIYIDPPYGIKYNSNWQIRLNDRNVKDGDDASLSGEPEVIKAFRDTWELGIHSYLSYLRDRLLVAKELLTERFVLRADQRRECASGRCVMDEVFGSENFADSFRQRQEKRLCAGMQEAGMVKYATAPQGPEAYTHGVEVY